MTSKLNIFIHESAGEILKAIRAPEFIVPTLAMPVAFYFLFGVAMGGGGNQALYLLATYGIFAVMGPAIFSFGAGVAQERERGWLQLARTSPAPASMMVAAKLFACLLVSSLSLLMIYAVAGFVADVRLHSSTWLQLFLLHLCAVVPFVFLGLSIGFTFRSTAAIALANLVFLCLAALGGLWLPIFMFPDYLQTFAQALPSYHLSELALHRVDASGERNITKHLIIILVMTLVLFIVSLIAWRKQRH